MTRAVHWQVVFLLLIIFSPGQAMAMDLPQNGQVYQGVYLKKSAGKAINLTMQNFDDKHYDNETLQKYTLLFNALKDSGWKFDGLACRETIRVVVGAEESGSNKIKTIKNKGAKIIWLDGSKEIYVKYGNGWIKKMINQLEN